MDMASISLLITVGLSCGFQVLESAFCLYFKAYSSIPHPNSYVLSSIVEQLKFVQASYPRNLRGCFDAFKSLVYILVADMLRYRY